MPEMPSVQVYMYSTMYFAQYKEINIFRIWFVINSTILVNVYLAFFFFKILKAKLILID